MRSFNISRRLMIFTLTSVLALLAFWWAYSTPRVIAQGPPVCVTPPPDMVSWWPGDGNANDIQGSNSGTLQNGATFAAGKVGQAFSLDGVDDYVLIGNPSNLKITNAITIDAWINTKDLVEGQIAAVVSKWSQTVGEDSYWMGIMKTGGVIKYNAAVGLSGVGRDEPFAGDILPNTWTHIALTYDSSTNLEILYIDGAVVASRVRPGGIVTSDRNVMIGQEGTEFPRWFKGLIDEVEIFNRALSDAEIQAIFNAGSAGKCKPGANNPPVANCQNVIVSAGASCTANASIDAGSSDPDGDTITLLQSPPGPYPVGLTNVMLTVTDGNGGSSTCNATVTVVDDAPPALTLTGQPIALWPPNHQYATINLAQLVASASDNCNGNLTGNVVIAQVSSDEPEDAPGGGDGNTLNDIVIAADCKSVQLRVERQGSGNGRVYTITFKVSDAAGNTTTATAKVTVPKSQNGNPAIDDSPVYTVNGNCP